MFKVSGSAPISNHSSKVRKSIFYIWCSKVFAGFFLGSAMTIHALAKAMMEIHNV